MTFSDYSEIIFQDRIKSTFHWLFEQMGFTVSAVSNYGLGLTVWQMYFMFSPNVNLLSFRSLTNFCSWRLVTVMDFCTVSISCHTSAQFVAIPTFIKGGGNIPFGLDEHIPSVCNRNKLFTEFEIFYQNILKDISHLNNDVMTSLKTKLRYTCDKYSRIKVPYKYHNVINNLRRKKQLLILKQDKGRRVVLLDKTRYGEKCFSIISTNKFKKLDKNPMVSYEPKIQRTLRKMKSRFTLQEYKKLAQQDQMLVNFMVLRKSTNYQNQEQLINYHYVQ